MDDLYSLIDFHQSLSNSHAFIAENAYYFEDVLNQMDSRGRSF